MSLRGVFTLPYVKVKDKFQVTIPAELREALHLSVGDILEATMEQDKIVLTPKVVVDRAEARAHLIEVLDRVHAKMPPSDKDPQAEEEEIAREIKAFRKEHAERNR